MIRKICLLGFVVLFLASVGGSAAQEPSPSPSPLFGENEPSTVPCEQHEVGSEEWNRCLSEQISRANPILEECAGLEVGSDAWTACLEGVVQRLSPETPFTPEIPVSPAVRVPRFVRWLPLLIPLVIVAFLAIWIIMAVRGIKNAVTQSRVWVGGIAQIPPTLPNGDPIIAGAVANRSPTNDVGEGPGAEAPELMPGVKLPTSNWLIVTQTELKIFEYRGGGHPEKEVVSYLRDQVRGAYFEDLDDVQSLVIHFTNGYRLEFYSPGLQSAPQLRGVADALGRVSEVV